MQSNATAVHKAGRTKKLVLLIPIFLLALAIIIVPYIDLHGVRTKIAAEASLRFEGEVAISRASLSLLPWPHLTLRGVRIESPRWGEASSDVVRIYPRLLPLVKKKLAVKRLYVKEPVLDLALRTGTIEQGADIVSSVDQKVARVIPRLELEGGMVNILRPEDKEPFFTIHGVTGNITSSKKGAVRSEFRFSCPGAERIELRVSIREKDKKGTSCSFLAAGTGVTIEKIRGVVLEVLGEHKTVQKVFRIFEGGELSRITFHGEGKDLKEALDFKRNVRVRGTIADGRISTPPGPLPLEEASGEFEIEEAVLRCWDADVRLGTSTAQKGELVLGLIPEKDVFHLESVVDADAADLTHYLPLILKREGLKKELESFQEAQGRGKGTLVLGENIHQIRPQVEVKNFQCSFRHANSPGRIALDGGQLSLQDGKSTWSADTVTWKGCRWKNAEGSVTFGDQGITITVANANLCGLHSKGSIDSHAGVITHSFWFWAEGADLASAIQCLWGKDAHIEGEFLLDGDMWAAGREDPLREASEGSLVFISRNGRIYRWTLLSRLFGMLNIIGLFEGKLPDFTQQGFPYDTFIITGELRDGYLYLNEAVIDGPAMKIVGEGKVDLIKGEADIAVLVAPLKTVDIVMKHIPLVGKIVTGKNGTFISVPFRVKGPLGDPKVALLPPEAAGKGLWGVLKRTLQSPVKAFKTVISKK